jgi:hypothetical protein
MITKYFCQKFGEKWAFYYFWFLQKNYIVYISFREKRTFFAENFRKSHKIVIITSTPNVRCVAMAFIVLCIYVDI